MNNILNLWNCIVNKAISLQSTGGEHKGLVYNNIHNVLNPRKGVFSELAFLNYSDVIGSDYNLNTFLSDNRFYIPIIKCNRQLIE